MPSSCLILFNFIHLSCNVICFVIAMHQSPARGEGLTSAFSKELAEAFSTESPLTRKLISRSSTRLESFRSNSISLIKRSKKLEEAFRLTLKKAVESKRAAKPDFRYNKNPSLKHSLKIRRGLTPASKPSLILSYE